MRLRRDFGKHNRGRSPGMARIRGWFEGLRRRLIDSNPMEPHFLHANAVEVELVACRSDSKSTSRLSTRAERYVAASYWFIIDAEHGVLGQWHVGVENGSFGQGNRVREADMRQMPGGQAGLDREESGF